MEKQNRLQKAMSYFPVLFFLTGQTPLLYEQNVYPSRSTTGAF